MLSIFEFVTKWKSYRAFYVFWIMSLSFRAVAQVNCDSIPLGYTGKCRSYNSKGLLYHEATYVDGLLHGKERYLENGFLRLEFDYVNGLLSNKKEYKDTNKLYYSEYYENGILKLVIAYHDNGNKNFEIERNGTLNNGWSTYYYSNGQLKSKLYYTDGVEAKAGEGYYSNGKLHYLVTYDEKTKTENHCQYYDNGQKEFCWVKVNDIAVSDTFEVYYPSGHLKSSHYTFKDQSHVLIIKYDEEGKIIGREINNFCSDK